MPGEMKINHWSECGRVYISYLIDLLLHLRPVLQHLFDVYFICISRLSLCFGVTAFILIAEDDTDCL